MFTPPPPQTLYDFLPGGKRQQKRNPQETITLGAFSDTLEVLGKAGRLTGEALKLWQGQQKGRRE